jgi:hypothetical protein
LLLDSYYMREDAHGDRRRVSTFLADVTLLDHTGQAGCLEFGKDR